MEIKSIENYIDKLYANHNNGSSYFQLNTYSRKKFYEILKSVASLIENKPDYTVEEYREVLYQNSGIEKRLRDYILKERAVPGLSINYGTELYKESITIGNREEVKKDENGKVIFCSKPMTEDTIFDLASTSKTFTMIAILKLCEEGALKLDDKITFYAPQFKNLDKVSIYDLLSFNVPLQTSKRIEHCNNVDEALGVLFDIKIGEKTNRSYTDMGSMVLKYVVEGITKKPLLTYLKEICLEKYNMKDTTSLIGCQRKERTAPTNFDVKISKNGEIILNNEPNKGIPYDPKARLLCFSGNSFVGHAGMFSTAEDMSKLAKSLINYEILKENSLNEASIVRNPNEEQYHGFLNFLKNENIKESEVHPALSGKTIASPGWCGTYFMYDPVNKLYLFSGANRSHNRITSIADGYRNSLLKDENNRCCVIYNGRKVIDSTRFVYERDEAIRERIVILLLQYKMLEDLLNLKKEENYSKKMHRNII